MTSVKLRSFSRSAWPVAVVPTSAHSIPRTPARAPARSIRSAQLRRVRDDCMGQVCSAAPARELRRGPHRLQRRCVAVDSDPLNCGGCNVACPSGSVCALGKCTTGAARPGSPLQRRLHRRHLQRQELRQVRQRLRRRPVCTDGCALRPGQTPARAAAPTPPAIPRTAASAATPAAPPRCAIRAPARRTARTAHHCSGACVAPTPRQELRQVRQRVHRRPDLRQRTVRLRRHVVQRRVRRHLNDPRNCGDCGQRCNPGECATRASAARAAAATSLTVAAPASTPTPTIRTAATAAYSAPRPVVQPGRCRCGGACARATARAPTCARSQACGDCMTMCAANEACSMGMCVQQCPTGQARCTARAST